MRRGALLTSLIVNLGMLFTFKYWNFFGDSVNGLLGSLELRARFPDLEVLLPVGISFYTFQTMAYSLDVYLRRAEPSRSRCWISAVRDLLPAAGRRADRATGRT